MKWKDYKRLPPEAKEEYNYRWKDIKYEPAPSFIWIFAIWGITLGAMAFAVTISNSDKNLGIQILPLITSALKATAVFFFMIIAEKLYLLFLMIRKHIQLERFKKKWKFQLK